MENRNRYRFSFFSILLNKSSFTFFIGYSTSAFICIINRRYSIFCCIVSPLLYHHKSISAAIVLSFTSAPVAFLILPFFLYSFAFYIIYIYIYVCIWMCVCYCFTKSHYSFYCAHIYISIVDDVRFDHEPQTKSYCIK